MTKKWLKDDREKERERGGGEEEEKGEKNIKGERGRDKEILDSLSGVFSRLFDLPSFRFSPAIVAFEIKDFKCGPAPPWRITVWTLFSLSLLVSISLFWLSPLSLFVAYVSPSLLSPLYFYVIYETRETRSLFSVAIRVAFLFLPMSIRIRSSNTDCFFVSRKSENDAKRKLWLLAKGC